MLHTAQMLELYERYVAPAAALVDQAALVDDAGHAVAHEQPAVLRALLAEWLARVERTNRSA